MLISEEHFRNLYRSFIVVKSEEDAIKQEKLLHLDSMDFNNLEKELENFIVDRKVNALLLYPYIDHTAGMSFMFVANAFLEDNRALIYNRQNFDSISNFRKDALNDKEFVYAENLLVNDDFDLESHMEFVKNSTEIHMKDMKLEAFRMLDLIDSARENDYPDDILVYFFKEGLNPEGMWVRGEKLGEGFIIGKLLNQPNQDFGVSAGDEIKVILQKDSNDEIVCVADLDGN